MKKCTIAIFAGQTQDYFEDKPFWGGDLNITGLIISDGEWNCLPGDLPSTKGYFNYNRLEHRLNITERNTTILEDISTVLTGFRFWAYLVLLDFNSFIMGSKGLARVFRSSDITNRLFRERYGDSIENHPIFWKITTVN